MPQIFKKSPIFRKNKLKNGKNFLKTKNTHFLSALKTRPNRVLKKKSRLLPTKKFFLNFFSF